MENLSCGETLYHPRSIGYSIQFEPEKPSAPAPKRIKEYVLKPIPSYQELEQKLLHASIRKKVIALRRRECYLLVITEVPRARATRANTTQRPPVAGKLTARRLHGGTLKETEAESQMSTCLPRNKYKS